MIRVSVISDSVDHIDGISIGLRRLAGECGYRSMLVALGVSSEGANACEVLNYEAPFGVGYLVAQLSRAAGADART